MKPEHREKLMLAYSIILEAHTQLQSMLDELPNYGYLIGNEFAAITDEEKVGSELRDAIEGTITDYISIAEGELEELLGIPSKPKGILAMLGEPNDN